MRIDPDALREKIESELSEAGLDPAPLIAAMRRYSLAADKQGDIPSDFWKDQNIRQMNLDFLPPEFGGNPVLATCVRRASMAERLGEADPSLTIALPGPALTFPAIMALGELTQQKRLFARFDRDVPVWAAFALTEPHAGSDATNLKTTWREAEGGYVLNGEKWFIGCAARADYIVVFTAAKQQNRLFGLNAFVVDAGSQGLSVEPHDGALGMRAAQLSKIRLTECWVPKSNRLDRPDATAIEGKALAGAARTFDFMRPILSSVMVGAMRAMLAAGRAALPGIPARSRQTALGRIEALEPQVQTARLLVLKAAWYHDAGLEITKQASVAKAFCGHLAMDVANEMLQVVRPDAGEPWHLLCKLYRDAKSFDILEGTGDVQRMLISRARRRERPIPATYLQPMPQGLTIRQAGIP